MTPESTPILELIGLHRRFGPTIVLDGVDLSVEAGERHALIGPNGAGKSTLFDLASGRRPPTAGRIRLAGRDVTGLAPDRIRRLGLARSFQQSRLFPRLTVAETLATALRALPGPGSAAGIERRVDALLERLGLAGRRTVRVADLSYADQRILEIGVTVAGPAPLILLDEPTAGLSRAETERMVRLIAELTIDRTLLMVEHDMSVVFGLADRISVLVQGKVLATGTPTAIRADSAVQTAYLGIDPARVAMAGRSRNETPAHDRIETPALLAGAPPIASPGERPRFIVRDLIAGYGDAPVLRGIDLEVGAGEIVAVLGRNGAGRTTLARALVGQLPATGSIRLDGRELIDDAPFRRAHAGLGYVPEDRQVFPSLTVDQNLRLGLKRGRRFGPGQSQSQSRSRVPGRAGTGEGGGAAPPIGFDLLYRRFPGLDARRGAKAGVLSGGEQQLLTLCRTVVGEPAVMIIDEPTEGLAPALVDEVAAFIGWLGERGLAVLLIEQKLTMALAIADRVLVMGGGRIVFDGTPAALAADDTVRRAWLEVGDSRP